MISNYFKELRQAPELGLVDYIIHRSKLSCNYIKLISLIERSCKTEEDENYGSNKIEINFYPVRFSILKKYLKLSLYIFSWIFSQPHPK
jgi:hypothetical protein